MNSSVTTCSGCGTIYQMEMNICSHCGRVIVNQEQKSELMMKVNSIIKASGSEFISPSSEPTHQSPIRNHILNNNHTPSKATKWIVRYLKNNRKKHKEPFILDFGAGNGRNAFYIDNELKGRFRAVNPLMILYDIEIPSDVYYKGGDSSGYIDHSTEGSLNFIGDMPWSFVTCNFILNELEKEERAPIINLLDKFHWDYLVIEVFTRNKFEFWAIENDWEKCADGWLIGSDEFVVGYSLEEIQNMSFRWLKNTTAIVNENDVVAILFERSIDRYEQQRRDRS